MEKKKAVIYSTVALIALVILVVGATYAYFQNQYGSASNVDVNVTTYTTDVLTFETGDAINFTADQETFAQGKGNRTGSTFARATLQANNKTNSATANYYLYLNITNNEFTYTKEGTPELILQVIDKATGNPVTSITGLNYVTVTDGNNTDIKGFDITDKSGLITLLDNKEISASPKTVEEYTITLTLINHSFDQYNNTNKNFSGRLMIQKNEYILTATDVCPGKSLSDCVIAQYTGIKNSNIYYHDSNLENGAEDKSYRYAGASDQVNNYVCFGSTTTPCPEDNLYRIIGVFGDRVKLIKNKSVGDQAWDTGRKNTWSTSSLNSYLNNEFINTFDQVTKDKIAMTTWKVGGNTYANIGTQPAKIAYENEINHPVTTNTTDNATTYSAKIGLMYVSDYGFAASPSAWTTHLSSYYDETIKTANWMYIGIFEWTISRSADNDYVSSCVNEYGSLNSSGFHVPYSGGVRPVFSLISSVTYVEGNGTQNLPIRTAD